MSLTGCDLIDENAELNLLFLTEQTDNTNDQDKIDDDNTDDDHTDDDHGDDHTDDGGDDIDDDHGDDQDDDDHTDDDGDHGNDGEDDDDDKIELFTITFEKSDFDTYSTSEEILEKNDHNFGCVNVGNYGNGIQFKASNGKLYNKTSLGFIQSVIVTEQKNKSHDGLTVSFGSTQSEAALAAGTKLNTTGVSGNNKPFLFITTGSSASYAAEISITYSKTEGGGGTTTTAKLSSISVSGQRTNYTIGETFSFTGTCTASYSNGSTKIVNPKVTAPDMSTEGQKTVTVSYTENGVTKTTSYTITISKQGTTTDTGTYYSGINPNSSTLLADLRTLNLGKRKKTVGYDGMGTSASSSSYIYTDYDPATVKVDSSGHKYGTKILSFYSGTPTTSWNREHVWPRSRGGGKVDNDIFMTRPTISSENSDRGNSSYVEGMAHSANGWDPVIAFGANNVYQSIRGECARIIFYCLTVSADLKLKDDADTSYNNSIGKLSDLLKWNLEYPVNAREITRNEGGEFLQGNRNAFVDHPEYVCKIWGNTNDATRKICGVK